VSTCSNALSPISEHWVTALSMHKFDRDPPIIFYKRGSTWIRLVLRGPQVAPCLYIKTSNDRRRRTRRRYLVRYSMPKHGAIDKCRKRARHPRKCVHVVGVRAAKSALDRTEHPRARSVHQREGGVQPRETTSRQQSLPMPPRRSKKSKPQILEG